MHARMLGLQKTVKFELYVNLPKIKVAASIFYLNKLILSDTSCRLKLANLEKTRFSIFLLGRFVNSELKPGFGDGP